MATAFPTSDSHAQYLSAILCAVFNVLRRFSMKFALAAICIISVLSAASPSFAAGDAAAGKEIFSKKCASCHGAAGEGKESVAKTLKVTIRPLASKEVQAKTDEELKKNFLEGTGKMKGVAGIDAKAADDVVAYVRTPKK